MIRVVQKGVLEVNKPFIMIRKLVHQVLCNGQNFCTCVGAAQCAIQHNQLMST